MKNIAFRKAIAPIAIASFAVASLARAAQADWPQFRGPQRDGVSAEKGLLKSWPKEGPKVLWKVAIGDGYSHLSVAANRIYTMYGLGEDELVACHDAATGKELWRYRTDSKWRDSQGNGPRATPTVDGETVYALGARGKLVALDTKAGKLLWAVDLVKEHGAAIPQWGISTSPLVEGDLLLVDVGGSAGKSAMAFEKKTGKVAWSSQTDKPGYSAPVIVTVGGVRQALFFTGTKLSALAPADGKLYWQIPWQTSYDINAAMPLFVPPDKLFVSSGYDTGSALLRIRASGGGASVAVEELWKTKLMKNQFSSSVIKDGYLYGFDNRILKCLELASGTERWKQGGMGHGSLILADGHLIVLSERGRLALVEANPAEYREKAGLEVFSSKCWTAPTLANGVLYLRDESQMLALKIAG